MKFSSVLLILLAIALSQAAFAKEEECCWIDIKTGKRVPTAPDAGINHMGITGHEFADFHGGGETHDPGVAVLSNDRKSARNSRTGQNYARVPCPPPGQATGETLKKVFESVHIGIGIGGGQTFGHDEHHHGTDRHRTADKVSTDKTKTHKTSPTTTRKTVTSACRCHPCTCSPCTCH
jgi:hypothetical protein